MIMTNTADKLRASIKEAMDLLAKIEKRPIEPDDDRSLVMFEFQFNGYGAVYTYGAVKVNGKWYLTGSNKSGPGSALSWEALFDWFEARGTVYNMQRAKTFEPLFPAVPDDVHRDASEMVVNGQKIQAIKRIRTATGMGLREAKIYADRLANEPGFRTLWSDVSDY